MTSTRFFAAVVALLIVLPLIAWQNLAGSVFVVAVTMMLCAGEYAEMAFPGNSRYPFYWLVVGNTALLAGTMSGRHELSLAAGAVVMMATMLRTTLAPPDPISSAADQVGRMVLGLAWIGGLCPFVLVLRSWEHGFMWVILVMVISFFGDTGAYFAGRQFGATPLHPRVSPKKSWEGFWGGIAASTVGAVLVKATLLPELALLDAVCLGALGSAAGVCGDLSESLLKRSFDVKDSGWIMPGHGGMLDRIDSLLFVGPTVYAFLTLVGHLPPSA